MGTKTLLNGVNDVLKRVQIIQGDTTALTTLADAGRQNWIDVAVQIWNEAMQDLYMHAYGALPSQAATANITLLTSTREYSLPSDLETIRWPLHDTTNGQYILEYPGGFEAMRVDQLQPANWTGLPYRACVNPTNDKLRMDRIPTSGENGKVYELYYDKRLSVTTAAATFPFSDTVYDVLVPVVAQYWRGNQDKVRDEKTIARGIGDAAALLRRMEQRIRW